LASSHVRFSARFADSVSSYPRTILFMTHLLLDSEVLAVSSRWHL
jgi:hypothetical protein